MRGFKALIVGVSVLGVAAPALAAPSRPSAPVRIIAFGDSYADEGNFFEITRVPRPAVYPTGRFSGGTNFVDSLQAIYGAEQLNFAIGGAFTGPGNTGFNNITGRGIPGFGFEVDRFLGGGGGPFPTVTPSFGPRDLLAVSIGGNDARFYQFNGGTVAGAPARAAISVAEARAGLDRLVGAGARNILFLAGNVGDLPEVRGTAISQVGTAFSRAFNQGIQAPLAGYAADGALVHYLDLTLIGNRVRENPQAFGLQSADACPVACVSNPALQSQYLFYVDRVHLTSAGFEIVARYAQRQIDAPAKLGAIGELGITAAKDLGQTLQQRANLQPGETERPLSLFLYGTGSRRNVAATENSFGYDLDNTGAVGGLEYNASGFRIGAAVSYTGPKAQFGGGEGEIEGNALAGGLYAAFGAGPVNLQGQVGYGKVDFESRRAAVIDTISADFDGDLLTAGAEASLLFPFGALRVGPVVALDYARAEVDGFTEKGDAALTLAVSDQKLSSLVGQAGLELRGDLEVGGLGIRPYAQLAAAKDFDGDGDTVRFAATAAPTIVNSVAVGGEEDDIFGHFEAGASFDLSGRASLEIAGSGTFEKPGGNDLAVLGGLSLRF